jgi:hypothetical protein
LLYLLYFVMHLDVSKAYAAAFAVCQIQVDARDDEIWTSLHVLAMEAVVDDRTNFAEEEAAQAEEEEISEMLLERVNAAED